MAVNNRAGVVREISMRRIISLAENYE